MEIRDPWFDIGVRSHVDHLRPNTKSGISVTFTAIAEGERDYPLTKKKNSMFHSNFAPFYRFQSKCHFLDPICFVLLL